MFKENYIDENNAFVLSEQFKSQTIALLEQKYAEKQSKTIKFPAKKVAAAAVAACIALIAVMPKNDKTPTVYTIADAKPIEITIDSDKKYLWDTSFYGGMGYEGLMFKDISQYDNGNPYKTTDSFDTLPVYRYVNLTEKDIADLKQRIMNSLDKTDDEIIDEKCTYTEFIYIDGHLASQKEHHLPFISESDDNFDKTLLPLSYYDLDLGDVSIRVHAANGSMHIKIDSSLSPKTHEELLQHLETELSAVLGFENTVTAKDIDYNIYGEENPSYYIYSHSENYADNLFNYSVNRGNAAYLTSEDSLEESDYISVWQNIAQYEKGEELTAISYEEALGLLYEGKYQSSVPYEITEESVVSRIELVYKEPPFDSMYLEKSELSLPFYKFYVEIEDMGIKEHGLEDYGIYYVCAIHPDLVEITDNYAQFN